MSMPFQVVFSDSHQQEIPYDNWVQGDGDQYPVWNCKAQDGSVVVTVRDHFRGSYVIKIMNIGKTGVTGWWGIRRKWHFTPRSYTLVPGVFYNGNYQEHLNDLPFLKMPENPRYQLPLSAASMPAVFYADFDSGKGFLWLLSPCTMAGYNGVEFDGAAETLTVWLPAKEERIYRYKTPEKFGRAPYLLQPQQSLTLLLTEKELSAANPAELFDCCWQNREQLNVGFPQFASPEKFTPDTAAQLIGDWLMKKHFVRGAQGEPMFLDAFEDIKRANEPYAGFVEWNVTIGWCSGTMTALPLLKLNETTRKAATEYIDFLCREGFFPSGLKKPIFDGISWIDPLEKPAWNVYEHVRFYGDFAYYLGRCIRFEAEQGRKHPAWESVFHAQIELFLDLWKRRKDFGIFWATDAGKLELRRPGSAAGAFPFLAIAESLRHISDAAERRSVLLEIAETYAERVLKTGRSNGGPLDINEADDSESIAALANAYLECYELTRIKEFLEYGIQAAKIFASWVMSYRPLFPPASSLAELDLKGGVIANVQNRHVGPGICTNSGAFLKKLAEYTGEQRWAELYAQIGKAAIECVCSGEKEFPGASAGCMVPFARGMVSEQINVSDALNFAGESWRVSASWPATAILLYWFDLRS